VRVYVGRVTPPVSQVAKGARKGAIAATTPPIFTSLLVERLREAGVSVWVRLPVAPGRTSIEDADWVCGMPIPLGFAVVSVEGLQVHYRHAEGPACDLVTLSGEILLHFEGH